MFWLLVHENDQSTLTVRLLNFTRMIAPTYYFQINVHPDSWQSLKSIMFFDLHELDDHFSWF